jgi:hypothetical protein
MAVVKEFETGVIGDKQAHALLKARQAEVDSEKAKKRKAASSKQPSEEDTKKKWRYHKDIKRMVTGAQFLVITAGSYHNEEGVYRQFSVEDESSRKLHRKDAISWVSLVRILADKIKIDREVYKPVENWEILSKDDVETLLAQAEKTLPHNIPARYSINAGFITDHVMKMLKEKVKDNKPLCRLIGSISNAIKTPENFRDFMAKTRPNDKISSEGFEEFKKTFFLAMDTKSRDDRERRISAFTSAGVSEDEITRLRNREREDALFAVRCAYFREEALSDQMKSLVDYLITEDPSFAREIDNAKDDGNTCAEMLKQLATGKDEAKICEELNIDSCQDAMVHIPEAERNYNTIKTALAAQGVRSSSDNAPISLLKHLSTRIVTLEEKPIMSVEDLLTRCQGEIPVEGAPKAGKGDTKNQNLSTLIARRAEILSSFHTDPTKVPEWPEADKKLFVFAVKEIRKYVLTPEPPHKTQLDVVMHMVLLTIRRIVETRDTSKVYFNLEGRGIDSSMFHDGSDEKKDVSEEVIMASRVLRAASSPDAWNGRLTEKFYVRNINKSGFTAMYKHFMHHGIGKKLDEYIQTEYVNWMGDLLSVLFMTAGHARATTWEKWDSFVTDPAGTRLYESILTDEVMDTTDDPAFIEKRALKAQKALADEEAEAAEEAAEEALAAEQAKAARKAARVATKPVPDKQAMAVKKAAGVAKQAAKTGSVLKKAMLKRFSRFFKHAKSAKPVEGKLGKPAEKAGKKRVRETDPAASKKVLKKAKPAAAKAIPAEVAGSSPDDLLPKPADAPAEDAPAEDAPAEDAPAPAGKIIGRKLGSGEIIVLSQVMAKTVENYGQTWIDRSKLKAWPDDVEGVTLSKAVYDELEKCLTTTPVGFFEKKENITIETIAALQYPYRNATIQKYVGPGRKYDGNTGVRWLVFIIALGREYFKNKPRHYKWLQLDQGFKNLVEAASHEGFELPAIWQEPGPETQLSQEL